MGTGHLSKINLLILITSAVSLTFITYLIINLVYSELETPYMDEIFHIPQAQAYCESRWTKWDDKLTTLPGLYLVSYFILKVLGSPCSVYNLRLTNALGTTLNFILAFLILEKLNKVKKKKKNSVFINLISAINISIFPPLYFFTFLYYTDVWSVTFVLLMYHQHLSSGKYSNLLAGVSGFFSILMRQTNVIWVGLMIIDQAWCTITKNFPSKGKKDLCYTFEVLKMLTIYLPFSRGRLPKKDSLSSLVLCVLSNTYTYLCVCLAFVMFVIVNGSIVVGDKKAHIMVIHPMQNLYFVAFLMFFSLPFTINIIIHTRKELPNLMVLGLHLCLCSILSEINKLEHPYLLADNRHLAFYIWKRIFGHQLLRRVVIPIYALGFIITYRLLRHCDFVFLVALALCTILNLTGQFLFELRYYIIPFIMCRLHFRGKKSVYIETLFFVGINIFVFMLFLRKPFKWSSEPNSLQRFIW